LSSFGLAAGGFVKTTWQPDKERAIKTSNEIRSD
jgi:hypothetical protein